MKHINFINTPTAQQKKQIYSWYRNTIISIIILLTTLCGINTYQWYEIVAIKNKKVILEKSLGKVQQLEKELQNINQQHEQEIKRQAKLKDFSTGKQPPFASLQEIAAIMPDEVMLNWYDYEKNGIIILKGLGITRKAITDFIENIKKSKLLSDVHLLSLQQSSGIIQKDNIKLFSFEIQAQA